MAKFSIFEFLVLLFLLFSVCHTTADEWGRSDIEQHEEIYYQEYLTFESGEYHTDVITTSPPVNYSQAIALISMDNITGGNFTIVILNNESQPVYDNYDQYEGIDENTLNTTGSYARTDINTSSYVIWHQFPYTQNNTVGTDHLSDDPYKFRFILYYLGSGTGSVNMTVMYYVVVYLDDENPGPQSTNNPSNLTFGLITILPVVISMVLRYRYRK